MATDDERFPLGSRYHGVELTSHAGTVHLQRRFIAPPGAFAPLTEHVVEEGDRLDLLAHRYFGDPDQWSRICDANGALDPDELLVVGRRLRITLPEGLPGPRHVR
jgi:nucleoid-associated protein YgaU